MQGIDPLELFDCTDVIQEAADFFYGNPDFSNLPRKHKYSIAATPDRDNAPEINCIALVGAIHEGQEGFGVLVGGGLSSVPRIAQELGVFVPKDEAVEVLAAITGAWAADLNYRVSRVKARLKFMIDDIGPEGMRERVEEHLGRRLADFALPAPELASRDHLGINAQKQPGLSYIGVPVHLGLISGDQMIAVADLAERAGADVRITRQQNFLIANVPDEACPASSTSSAGHRLLARGQPRARPLGRLHRRAALQLLGDRDEAAPRAADRVPRGALRRRDQSLGLQLDGCPHACAQHWIADLGFQGTTARDADGKRVQAYDIFVRGGLGPDAQIGKALFRRVPSEELDAAVAGLIQGWLDGRTRGRRVVPRLRAPPERRGAGPRRRARARQGTRTRGGGMSTELFDELEAGELSVEFEGEEPETVLEWALERFDRIAISTAFQVDGCVLIDMAARIRPDVRVFSVDTGRLPQETHDLADAIRERYPELRLELLSPDASQLPAPRRAAGHERLPQLRGAAADLLQRPQGAAADAAPAGPRRLDLRAAPRPVGDAHEHPQGRDRPRPRRDRQAQPAGRVDARTRSGTTCARTTSRRTRCTQRGYTSIGCAPCTRAIAPGEQARAGRWWWESGAPKECGIHCAIETGGFEHELHAIVGGDTHE